MAQSQASFCTLKAFSQKDLKNLKREYSFTALRKKKSKSKNQHYACARGKLQYVLKKYVPRPRLEEECFKRAKNEIHTYLFLQDKIPLPKLLAYDESKAYLIRKYENLVRIKKLSAKNASDAATLLISLHRLKKPKHTSLFNYGYAYYHTTLHRMLFNLQKKGIIAKKQAHAADSLFEQKKNAITKSARTFVHGDFHLENLFYIKKKLVPFDFEYAGFGNPAYDLAVFCMSALNSKNTAIFLSSYLKKKPIKNFDEIFKAMLLRRSIELLHAFAEKKDSTQFKTAKKAFESILN